jgi:benzaldehyde dehydrogenase (NAD)
MATSRHIVHERIAPAYLEALSERAARLPVGNPDTDEVALGPIINDRQAERVQRIVDSSVEAGAQALVGGARSGPFFPATVLAGVTPSMPAFTEELFGPVAPVTTFRDDDEAVELANSAEHGLAAAVQSGSREHAAALAERLRAGMVHINDQTINEESPAPFGGFGASGNGASFGGPANLEAFTKWQWVTSRETATPFPF